MAGTDDERAALARERAYERGVPRPASAAKAKNMRAVKRTGTKPELVLRRALHATGLRYRVDVRLVLSGKPVRTDIVFNRRRVVVFVDSCFWHRCPVHGTLPAKDAQWWEAKLNRNAERDAEVDQLLSQHGWTVVRAWEHEATDTTVARVRQALALPESGGCYPPGG